MNIKHILANASLSFLLHTSALAFTNFVTAATLPTEVTANVKAAEQFQVGSMFVERHGEHGPAIILIPGLSSGSWVWEDSVKQLVEVSPYNAADFASRNITEEGKRTYYQSLLQGAPQLQVVSINGARHFPMLDQPALFFDALQNYLTSVEK